MLELSVLAFAVCAVFVYILYWNKPKNVATTITVHEYADEIPADTLQNFQTTRHFIWTIFLTEKSSRLRNERIKGRPVPTLASLEMDQDWTIVLVFFGASMLFGAIHIAGWNFFFPTQVEKTLWRCASVYTTALSIVVLVDVLLGELAVFMFSGLLREDIIPSFETGASTFISVLYILARLLILVQTFRLLVYLPVDAFLSTWTANIPHF